MKIKLYKHNGDQYSEIGYVKTINDTQFQIKYWVVQTPNWWEVKNYII